MSTALRVLLAVWVVLGLSLAWLNTVVDRQLYAGPAWTYLFLGLAAVAGWLLWELA